MTFARINDELRWNTECPQRVPEFVRLRRRTFGVALADYDECRRLHILDELDWRTLVVNSRIIVNGCAKERDHPLIDEILPVITLPIANAGADHCSFKSIGLRDGPHRHESAITPSGHANS